MGYPQRKLSVQEGNYLIQEFNLGKSGLPIEYHESFHLMMPIVNKVNELCKEFGYVEGLDLFSLRVISVTEKDLFDSLVQFIQWYNQFKTNSGGMNP
jgi:hypothetical protein